MPDRVERPNTTRYAKGAAPRPPASGASTPARKAQPGTHAPAPAVAGETHRALVAEKLAGFAAVTWDWSQIQDYTVSTIQEILAARAVPAEYLASPRLDIAVPAIEAMRYSGLKRELALLIASTMETGRADDAHPSFIEILKQLTRDEVRMIASLPGLGQVLPFANINYTDRSGRILSSLRYIVPDFLAGACERRRALASYIDNLLRLNLIAAPAHMAISDERFYRDLLSQAFIADFEAGVPAHLKATIDRRVLCLTDFGNLFRSCCVDQTVYGHQALR
jgi:hypothetical protein